MNDKVLCEKQDLVMIAHAVREAADITDNFNVPSLVEKTCEMLREGTKLPTLGSVETCTVTITYDYVGRIYAYSTIYSDNMISAAYLNDNSSNVYILENVVCGSMLYINSHYYTTVPAYTLGNGVTVVDKTRSVFRAPTQAGANGTIRIRDDM